MPTDPTSAAPAATNLEELLVLKGAWSDFRDRFR